MLASLLVVPVVVAAYVASRRRRARRAAVLAGEGLVVSGAGGRMRVRRHVPFALFTAALIVLGVALARPAATVRTPRREGTVVLAIDISNSMRAADVAPTRIEAAKTAARAFVRQQPAEVRIGVVAFGEGAVIVQPPTLARGDVVKAIDRLSVGGGTSLGKGLLTALDAIAGKTLSVDQAALESDSGQVDIGYYGGTTIVVLSDGEETSRPDPVAMAGLASVAGVRVHTVGVGTGAGTTVDIDGFSVATALDRDLLEQVASHAGGTYHEAGTSAGLVAISKSIDLRFKVVSQHTEITGALTAVAVVLLTAGALFSVLWLGRIV
jgi:Ca-activated chloride channel family protein